MKFFERLIALLRYAIARTARTVRLCLILLCLACAAAVGWYICGVLPEVTHQCSAGIADSAVVVLRQADTVDRAAQTP